MKTITRGLLTSAAAYLAIPGFSPASAEEPLMEAGDQQTRVAATTPESDDNKRRWSRSMEEVIVTAQKREERLQDVPIAITVLSGADLDKFTGTSANEALAQVPGVSFNQGGLLSNGAVLNVRGVSAAQQTFGGSSPVAYYVDSVPFGLQRAALVPDPNAYDLERVEALRGPQGTLYGANALNGVVRVLTHDANLNDFEVKTRASASTIDKGGESYRGDLAANIPIMAGKLGARVTLGYLDESGWIDRLNKKDVNSGYQSNARLKINAQPTEKLSIGASVWISRSRYDATALSTEDYQYDGVLDQPQSSDFEAVGLRVGYEFSGFSVSSMTSYVNYTSDNVLDATPVAAVFNAPFFVGTTYFTGLDSEVLSQEVLLTSTGEGAWRWSLGGFYRDAKDRTHQEGVFVPAPIIYNDLSESSAVFGELTRVFGEGKFELTGGLRYFKDRVTLKELVPNTGVPGDPLAFDRETFDDVSPRVVLAWHPSDDLTLYGSYAKGFRSGINQTPPVIIAAPAYPPAIEDSLQNYEVGAKGNAFSGRLNYDAALYYIEWKDVQQSIGVPIGIGVYAAFVNGVSASGLGVDLALTARLVGGWQLSGSFSWNDLGFDEPTLSPVNGAILFEKGGRLALSSEYTAGAALGYVFPFGSSGLEGGFSAGVNWRSSQRAYVANSATGDNQPREGDDILFARADFSVGAADRWRVLLYVDNLSNEQSLLVDTNPGFPSWSTYTRPRSIGLQLEYRY